MFEQADVPGHQRGRRKSKDLPEGKVPRHDREDRTQRLEALLRAARVGRDGLRSEVTLGVLDVVATPGGALLDLAHSGLAQLAHLQRHQAGERILPLLEQHGSAGHALGPIGKAGAGELGFLGIGYPEEYGGQGGDAIHDAVFAEEMARCGSGGVSAGIGAHIGIATPPIFKFGTEDQKQRWLVPAIRGQRIGALAITEPGGG